MLLVFLMLPMLVAPLPVIALKPSVKPVIGYVRFVPLLQPVTVSLVFALIPVVIILVIAVVYPMLPLFLFVTFMIPIVLWRRHRQCPNRH